MSARFRTRAAASASFPFPGPEYAMRATLVPVGTADGLAGAHRMSVKCGRRIYAVTTRAPAA